MIARDYQRRILIAAREKLKTNRHVIVYAPQGAGKGPLCAFMARDAAEKGNKTAILTHRVEVLKQDFAKIESIGVNVATISRHSTAIPVADVYCISVQTLISRCAKHQEWRDFAMSLDFIIEDECHRGEFCGIHKYFKPNVWAVGLTGTVLRYGNMEQLADFYSDVVCVVKPKELIELKHILPSENYIFDAPKLDDVEVYSATGDYNQIKLQSKFAKSERYLGIVENYQRICPGKKALVFTTGAKHCVDLTKSFCEAGIKAKYLLSVATNKCDFDAYSGKREDVLWWLKRGEIEVVVSVEMLSTGFDEPSLECVILDFSTKSYTKYQQAVARADRPYPGQDKFYVLDFGNNVKTFGKFESDPIISLFHKTGDGGVPPTKMCPTDRPDQSGLKGCGRLIPVSVMKCPFCGYQWLTEKEEYHVELQLMVDEVDYANETIKQYCARKKLAGWDNKWILRDICKRNPDNQKKAFMEAIKVLRGDNGELISPGYWWVFRKLILKQK